MVTIVSIILCWIQFFIRIPYPYLELAQDPGVNIFMSNENEIGEPLGFMLVIYLYRFIFCKCKHDILIICNILFFLFVNDAKLTMIGIFVAVIGLLIFKIYTTKLFPRHVNWRVFLLMLIAIIIAFIAAIIFFNPTLVFRDYHISIYDLLLNSVINIFKLTPLPGAGGSLIDRTNAIIYGLIELKKTYFLGIGLGNSVTMLAMPEYTLRTAKSMHNIIMQFLVEFGVLAFYVYFKIILWIIKSIKTVFKRKINILKIVFAISFIFISSQSSIGILSNYYSWMTIFFVAFISKDFPLTKERKSNPDSSL